MKVYVGVDWAAKAVDCTMAVEGGRECGIKGCSRTLAGVRDLLDRVRARGGGAEEAHVIIEAGAPGWVELFHHAGAVVHVVDPKQSKAFAASLCSSGAKDDRRDSALLLAMAFSARHLPPPWQPPDELRVRLEDLGTQHEMLTKESTAAVQRLRSHLRERFPALEAVLTDLSADWAVRLLRVIPTATHAANVLREDLERALKGARTKTRESVREALAAENAPWLTEGRAATEALRVEHLLAQIELYSQQIVAVEAQVDALTCDLQIRELLKSVGGIALKMAHRLLQFGLADTLTERDQLGIAMGASPVFQGSGKTSKGKSKGKAVMRRAAAPRARGTVYLLGRLASRQLDWAGRMYEDGRARGQSAATVYRRIARSLLRILTAMVRTGQPYDDARYVATLKAKGVSWAADLAAA